MKSGKGYRPADEVTCGGNALPFYAAIRLKLIRRQLLKTQDKVSFTIIKSVLCKNCLANVLILIAILLDSFLGQGVYVIRI